RSPGGGSRIGPMSAGAPRSARRFATRGASTAGASAQPGSAPPRPQAAPISSICRCIVTSCTRDGLRLALERAQRHIGPIVVRAIARRGEIGMAEKWQDWASFALGLWLAISPWVMGYADHEAATWNAVGVGLSLALASHF